MDNGNVQKFIDAWNDEFGERLTEAEASRRLLQLVELYKCLLSVNRREEAMNNSRGCGYMGTSERSGS